MISVSENQREAVYVKLNIWVAAQNIENVNSEKNGWVSSICVYI